MTRHTNHLSLHTTNSEQPQELFICCYGDPAIADGNSNYGFLPWERNRPILVGAPGTEVYTLKVTSEGGREGGREEGRERREGGMEI